MARPFPEYCFGKQTALELSVYLSSTLETSLHFLQLLLRALLCLINM